MGNGRIGTVADISSPPQPRPCAAFSSRTPVKARPVRGGGWRRVPADLDRFLRPDPQIDLVDLDDALARLAVESPVPAELVKLRFFAGMTVAEVAHVLGISVATAER